MIGPGGLLLVVPHLFAVQVEMSPKGFTVGVKAEIEKKLFNLPQVLINAELYDVVLAPRQKKKDTILIGRAICNPWDGRSGIY
jgi:hypothetical protein